MLLWKIKFLSFLPTTSNTIYYYFGIHTRKRFATFNGKICILNGNIILNQVFTLTFNTE